jgi:hypothetical protein
VVWKQEKGKLEGMSIRLGVCRSREREQTKSTRQQTLKGAKLIKSIPSNQINSTCFPYAKCTRLFVYIAEILGTEFHCEILRAEFITKR